MPGLKEGGGLQMCEKPTNYTTCSGFNDACMTVSYEVKAESLSMFGNVMMCGMASVCDTAGKAGCDNAKKACKYECCKEDLCNNKPLLKKPESAGRRDVAHFGAIFAASLLCLFFM